jgi:hypothetical protein
MAMILGTAIAFQGCGTIGALNNLVNGIIGTAGNAAGKTLNTAGNTASKALTPSTYSNLAKKSRRQSRSYTPSTAAPRTSARNHDAQNSSSNSVSKSKYNNASPFFRGRARR